MIVTAEGIRALRELTGMGLMDCRWAARIAGERFGGDLLAGVGYVARSGLAVFRRDGGRGLEREALAFAGARRGLPEWEAAAALFADPPERSPPAPGR